MIFSGVMVSPVVLMRNNIRGTCFLLSQWSSILTLWQQVVLKEWCLCAKLQGIISQKIIHNVTLDD